MMSRWIANNRRIARCLLVHFWLLHNTSAFALLGCSSRNPRFTRLHETASPKDDFLSLLDQSILLYSRLQQQQKWLSMSSKKGEQSPTEIDIYKLREKEVTTLIEKIVHASQDQDDRNTITSTTSTTLDRTKKTTSQTSVTASLVEISQQLDQVILDDYQSTFTEKEIEDWVARIQTLYVPFQAATQNALPTAADAVIPPEIIALEKLQERLEQLQTLIK